MILKLLNPNGIGYVEIMYNTSLIFTFNWRKALFILSFTISYNNYNTYTVNKYRYIL